MHAGLGELVYGSLRCCIYQRVSCVKPRFNPSEKTADVWVPIHQGAFDVSTYSTSLTTALHFVLTLFVIGSFLCLD